jgi:hypothetical protein
VKPWHNEKLLAVIKEAVKEKGYKGNGNGACRRLHF